MNSRWFGSIAIVNVNWAWDRIKMSKARFFIRLSGVVVVIIVCFRDLAIVGRLVIYCDVCSRSSNPNVGSNLTLNPADWLAHLSHDTDANDAIRLAAQTHLTNSKRWSPQNSLIWLAARLVVARPLGWFTCSSDRPIWDELANLVTNWVKLIIWPKWNLGPIKISRMKSKAAFKLEAFVLFIYVCGSQRTSICPSK